MPLALTPDQLISSNPGIWFETFGKIRSTSGRNIKPKMNVLQRRINALYMSRFIAQKPLRGIGLKPRKRGFSTMVAAIHYAQLQNFANQGVIIGDKLETSDIVFRMIANFAEHDGHKGKWGSESVATSEKIKWNHGSFLQQATARGKATCRGMTPQFIHMTEAAHFENPEEAMDAAMNSIPDSGFNVVFEESTPFGAGDAFALAWGAARWPNEAECEKDKVYWKKWEAVCPDQPRDNSGLSDGYFVRIFAAWFEFEESHIRLTAAQKREIEATIDAEGYYRGERTLMDLYLTEGPLGPRLGDEVTGADVWEQLAWRRLTIKTKCRGSSRIFAEEHPADPYSCFLASGRQVFDEDALTHIQLLTRRTAEYGAVSDSEGGAVWRVTGEGGASVVRWEAPKVGCRYILSVDLAEGEDQTKGENPDAHSALVWRDEYLDERGFLWPIKLAARVRPPNRMPMIPFARLVRSLARYYGNCVIIPEMNNSGMSFITALKMLDDGPGVSIWQRKERDPHSGSERAWDGWRTTDKAEYGGVRASIIWHFHELIRNKKVEICCPHYHSELCDFVDKRGRMEAGSGHDDDVISGCIGIYNIGAATPYVMPVRSRAIPRDVELVFAGEKSHSLAGKW